LRSWFPKKDVRTKRACIAELTRQNPGKKIPEPSGMMAEDEMEEDELEDLE
jgi:hypothetical protein